MEMNGDESSNGLNMLDSNFFSYTLQILVRLKSHPLCFWVKSVLALLFVWCSGFHRHDTVNAEEPRIARANITRFLRRPGQYWMEYDLKPYNQALKNVDRPQQALIDWIIRDTGTDVWFNEPCGVLTADRTTLRVYHNEGMQQTYDRSMSDLSMGQSRPQTYALRES